MNKNLPVEIWDMIEIERRKAFKLRVEEFEGKIYEAWDVWSNMHWKLLWRQYSYKEIAPYRKTLKTKRMFFIVTSGAYCGAVA